MDGWMDGWIWIFSWMIQMEREEQKSRFENHMIALHQQLGCELARIENGLRMGVACIVLCEFCVAMVVKELDV